MNEIYVDKYVRKNFCVYATN